MLHKSDRYPWRKDDLLRRFSGSPDSRAEERERRFVEVVQYAWRRIPFYRRLWQEHGIRVSDIRGLDDLEKLPTFDIHDLRKDIEERPPFGSYFAEADPRKAIGIITTGGTTGVPRAVMVRRADMPTLVDLAARGWTLWGIGSGDLIHSTFTFSTHGAAWLSAGGLLRAGASLLPASGGRTTPSLRQLQLMNQFRPNILSTTPTYAQILADVARSEGVEPRDLGIRTIRLSSEIANATTRRRIADDWGAEVYGLYGTLEIMVQPAVDCPASANSNGASGMHIWDDIVEMEVLDDAGKRLPAGSYGDLTVTSWAFRNGPRIRFRMGDLVALAGGQCACGLFTPRMLPVAGRVDDVLRINAQSIWPSAIDSVLIDTIPGTAGYVVLARKDGVRDILEVRVEVAPDLAGREDLVTKISGQIKARLAVSARVSLVDPGTTAAMTGAGGEQKVKRVIDLR